MSKQKFAFQICLTHVLFPNITIIKRQMQRQERTGHYHRHSKEEWNMFYECVNNRVQSNPQVTQDLRQWHKPSIEAEKKYFTRKHWTLQHAKTTENREQCPSKNSPFKYVWPLCCSQTSQAYNARCRDRREQVISTSTPKKSGTCLTMVWIIESKATDSLHKTCGNDTSLPSKQKKYLTMKHWTLQHAKTTVNREQCPSKKSPFKNVWPLCYSQTSQA